VIKQIDIAAGEIMDSLERSERLLPFTEVATLINRPIDVIYMALGWLIREHYVGVNEFAGNKYLFIVDRQTHLKMEHQGIREYVN
jgi:hypothetical protein